MNYSRILKSIIALNLFIFIHVVAYAGIPNIKIEDFGDPNAKKLWQALHDLETGARLEPLHIIQIGDSHTAGDYLTGRLRQQLQSRFGNAGVGWLTPGHISNQRSDLANLRGLGNWQMNDSKLPKPGDIFPLGGLFNTSGGASIMDIKTKQELASGSWQLSIWHKGSSIPWKIALPSRKLFKLTPTNYVAEEWNLSVIALNSSNAANLRLLAPSNSHLGGVALDRMTPGITLDSMGINGAKASVINRWHLPSLQKQLAWRNPHLIILAFGTNEAFENDITDYANQLRQAIRSLKQAAPNAAILIIGTPAAAKKRAPYVRNICRLPLPPNLIQVMNIQERVAKQEHTLFWDWSAVMGGKCGAIDWSNTKPPLMRKDLIHFSAEGYVVTADSLYKAILNAIENSQKE